MSKIQLQPGKRYVLRNGDVVGPLCNRWNSHGVKECTQCGKKQGRKVKQS